MNSSPMALTCWNRLHNAVCTHILYCTTFKFWYLGISHFSPILALPENHCDSRDSLCESLVSSKKEDHYLSSLLREMNLPNFLSKTYWKRSWATNFILESRMARK